MRYISAFLLTLIFDSMERLGPVNPLEKFWLKALKLKNCLMDPFKVSMIKAEYTKNVFAEHFPTEHNGLPDYLH